ncbi:TPA: DEAD/DEAH box helicase family protein, partial [Staphylococcus aureus]|nr:DEAD/DEAH box helicase family protein [Staphylococcus aureus]
MNDKNYFKPKKNENICILTPTKSLLSQTTLRIREKYPNKKIITNPEMYNGKNNNIIAVLTQERYLRLLQKHSKLKFDHLIIDEAHNILDTENSYDSRSILLAALIVLSKEINANTFLYFLTPIINCPDNLLPKYINISPKNHVIDEIV